MTDKLTLTNNEHALRPMRPEDRSYREVMMLFSDQPVKPKYWFKDFGDYWSCSCGQINRSDTCSNCGIARELLRRLFDSDTIGTDGRDGEADTELAKARVRADEAAPEEPAVVPSDAPSRTPEATVETTGNETGSETVEGDNVSPSFGEENELADYKLRKRRTRRIMAILVFLIVLLGGGLAAFYFYGLPEISRQNDLATDAARDSLVNALPGALSAYDADAVDFDINRNVGDHYYDKKNYEKAIEYYKKALEIKPDEGIRRKIDSAKFEYVSKHQDEGGAVFETYLEDLHKARHSGIQDIYNHYYTWEASIVANTDSKDHTTDMSTINRAHPIYFHTTISGGPPGDTLDLYYEITWPDGSREKRAISATKSSGETVTTTCNYTYPATPGEGKLTYRIFSNSNHKQLATDSVTLQ